MDQTNSSVHLEYFPLNTSAGDRFTIPPACILSLKTVDEINGEHSLTLETTVNLAVGSTLVLCRQYLDMTDQLGTTYYNQYQYTSSGSVYLRKWAKTGYEVVGTYTIEKKTEKTLSSGEQTFEFNCVWTYQKRLEQSVLPRGVYGGSSGMSDAVQTINRDYYSCDIPKTLTSEGFAAEDKKIFIDDWTTGWDILQQVAEAWNAEIYPEAVYRPSRNTRFNPELYINSGMGALLVPAGSSSVDAAMLSLNKSFVTIESSYNTYERAPRVLGVGQTGDKDSSGFVDRLVKWSGITGDLASSTTSASTLIMEFNVDDQSSLDSFTSWIASARNSPEETSGFTVQMNSDNYPERQYDIEGAIPSYGLRLGQRLLIQADDYRTEIGQVQGSRVFFEGRVSGIERNELNIFRDTKYSIGNVRSFKAL